ncbi:PhzF family phenazine biosynthesis protein [Lysobacter gummosus]|uniref:PhzF family phenazine biosynthesis protein n=1 Tax=Lysobacter gummosus TaxID=262324 RepID=A0ABY3X7B3_9GAMM|nr:PhzF family phenazine biosynthesis protein [Lysobacter gummosus]ALN92904.1 phenazine biosynthesis, PhzF family protein [Lysobacter gummosus]UNP28444.1 PhzF family phenazine biosynthesis protein [Lysobacter gummosus]
MSLRRYLQLDVFAHRIGAGNPLAVVFDAQGMDTAAMQSFAAWMHLPETIFLLPPQAGADYRVRIFTPRQELAFAGHPSIGAAWAVLDARRVAADRVELIQQCDAGLLPVKLAHDAGQVRVSIRTPRARACAVDAAHGARIDAALAGAARGALAPALWDNGPRWWLAELADAAAVRGLHPDLAAIAALSGEDSLGLAVFARSDETGHAWVVRAFCPGDGIAEDPVTGSANAAIASALLAAGRVARGDAYSVSQGREVGRDGYIELRIDEDGEVWIGGRVQAVIRGTVEW